jgi:hypothetical protein
VEAILGNKFFNTIIKKLSAVRKPFLLEFLSKISALEGEIQQQINSGNILVQEAETQTFFREKH